MQVRKALQPLIYVALCAAASSGAAAQVLSGMPNDGYHDRNDSSSVLENAMLAFCPQVLINPEKTGYFSGLEEEWDTEDGGRAFFRDFIAEDILVLAYPEEQTCTVLLDESITDVTLSPGSLRASCGLTVSCGRTPMNPIACSPKMAANGAT